MATNWVFPIRGGSFVLCLNSFQNRGVSGGFTHCALVVVSFSDMKVGKLSTYQVFYFGRPCSNLGSLVSVASFSNNQSQI